MHGVTVKFICWCFKRWIHAFVTFDNIYRMFFWTLSLLLLLCVLWFTSMVYTESETFTLTTRLLGQPMNGCFCFCFRCFSTYIVVVFIFPIPQRNDCVWLRNDLYLRNWIMSNAMLVHWREHNQLEKREMCLKANPKGYAKFHKEARDLCSIQ